MRRQKFAVMQLFKQSFGVPLAVALGAFVLNGCAEMPVTTDTTAANDEKCIVTGSNLPSRRCRMDVIVVAPDSMDSGAAGSRPSGGAKR